MDCVGNDAALRDRLIGALIGLARATEGNEHMITPSTGETMLDALSAIPTASDETLAALVQRVGEEKRKLVPDCFYCAMPCGRTADFAMEELSAIEEGVRALKLQILAAAQTLAGSRRESVSHPLLYRALYSVGAADWEEEALLPILQELEDAAK